MVIFSGGPLGAEEWEKIHWMIEVRERGLKVLTILVCPCDEGSSKGTSTNCCFSSY